MPGWHTIIRGLAPQAGGFRRRPNKNSSVGLSAWLIVCLGRLPCALQVVACHLQSVSYLNTCQACNPGSESVASHEQYITNKYAPSWLHEYRATFCYNCRHMNKGLICPDECYAIRGAIYEVHNEMGSGFKEEVYQQCLEREFDHRRNQSRI